MRRLTFIMLFSFLASLGYSQQAYFNNTYDIDGNAELSVSVEEVPGGGYMVLGDHGTTTHRAIELLNVDEYGDTNWLKLYGNAPLIYFTSRMIRLSDGSYVICGGVSDTVTADSKGLLAKFTSDGDSVWFRVYGGVAWDYIYDVRQTPDNGFILAGGTKNTANVGKDIWVMKTDSLGNVSWEKTYGGNNTDVVYSVNYTPLDSGFVLAGNGQSYGGGIYVLKLNKDGNKSWDKSINVNIPTQGGFVLESGGHYIVIGNKDNLDGNDREGYICKLDSDGSTILWERTFGGRDIDFFGKVIELDDGSYVAVGSTIGSPGTTGWIMKISNDGDSIWSHHYYVQQNLPNYFEDVKATKDKGFIICGYTADPTQDIWLVKLDSLGCLVEGCAVGLEEANHRQVQVNVIPNPFHGRTTVQIPQQTDEIEFELYDIFGRNVRNSTVTSTFTFYQEDLVAGLYLYRLRSSGRIVATGKLVID